jgi:hypothetical protein
LGIPLKLLQHDLLDVQTVLVRHLEGKVQNVGKLFLNLVDGRVFRILPEEALKQLGRFNGQSYGEIFPVMELVPVPLLVELAKLGQDGINIVHSLFETKSYKDNKKQHYHAIGRTMKMVEALKARHYSPATSLTQAKLQLSAPDEQAGRCGPAGMTEFV